jgi:hypothetical protein
VFGIDAGTEANAAPKLWWLPPNRSHSPGQTGILGSYFHGWTIAENFIAEKNVAHAPFEFGYDSSF